MANAKGRDVAAKVGDMVRYLVTPTGDKTSWGIMVSSDKSKANFAVDDKAHYGKRMLRHWELLLEVLEEAPGPEAPVAAKPKSSGRIAESAVEIPPAPVVPFVWEPSTFVQPKRLAGPEVTIDVAGEEITLAKGHKYGIAIPTNGVPIVKAFDKIGDKTRVTIFRLVEGRGGPRRGDDVLYLSLHPAMYKPVAEAFPTGKTL